MGRLCTHIGRVHNGCRVAARERKCKQAAVSGGKQPVHVRRLQISVNHFGGMQVSEEEERKGRRCVKGEFKNWKKKAASAMVSMVGDVTTPKAAQNLHAYVLQNTFRKCMRGISAVCGVRGEGERVACG